MGVATPPHVRSRMGKEHVRARVKLVMRFSNAFSAMPEKRQIILCPEYNVKIPCKTNRTADSIHTYAYIPIKNSTAVWEETKLKKIKEIEFLKCI